MHFNYSSKETTFRIIAFVFGLATLIAQFVLMQNGAIAAGEVITRTIRFFSFMTILTNILVALAYILPLVAASTMPGKLFARPVTQSAVLVYILIVCIGYHFLLSHIWDPQGLQKTVDISLHSLVPIIYLLFYILFVKKGTLVYRNIYKWLIYPFVYLVYALTRGLITGEYPYPFLNLGQHTVSHVLLIVLILFTGYGVLSLLVVRFDNSLKKTSLTMQ